MLVAVFLPMAVLAGVLIVGAGSPAAAPTRMLQPSPIAADAELNLTTTPGVTTDPAAPDLLVDYMLIQLETGNGCYISGTPMGISVFIVNDGLSDAPAFVIEINGERIAIVEGLASGDRIRIWSPRYSSDLNTASVDVDNQVPETDETNNTRSERLPIPTLPLPCPTGTPVYLPQVSGVAD
jgi:hypothetical protein